MENWSAHHLYQEANKKLGCEKSSILQKYAKNLILADLAVIFSLRHLSQISNVDYSVLRDTVKRKRESANYSIFAIKKRSDGRRFIHAVSGRLFTVQQFINTEILQKVELHPSSFAFHPNGGIRKCAQMHCGARWLFHFDIENFFYNVTEVHCFKIFQNIGYRPLLAFELARICTTTNLPKHLKNFTDKKCDFNHSYQILW